MPRLSNEAYCNSKHLCHSCYHMLHEVRNKAARELLNTRTQPIRTKPAGRASDTLQVRREM